jgi:hypothetical protein
MPVGFSNRVIGLPDESDWPENVSIPRSSFVTRHRRPLEDLVPNMDTEANDLIKVKEKVPLFGCTVAACCLHE